MCERIDCDIDVCWGRESLALVLMYVGVGIIWQWC